MNKKIVAFSVAMVLLLGVTLGVTFALLMNNTYTITNTFVAGGFGTLDLYETVGVEVKHANDADVVGNEYVVVPNAQFVKDPAFTYTPNAGVATPAWIHIELTGGWEWGTGEYDGEIVKKIGDVVALHFTPNLAEGTVTASDVAKNGSIFLVYDNEAGSTVTHSIIADNKVYVTNLTADQLPDTFDSTLGFKVYATQKSAAEDADFNTAFGGGA